MGIGNGNSFVGGLLGSLRNVEAVKGLVVVELGDSKAGFGSSDLSSKISNLGIGILKSVLGGSEGGISNVEVGVCIIIGLGGKTNSVLGIVDLSIGLKKLVVSIIKCGFGNLDISPSKVVGVLSILNIGDGSVVVRLGLGTALAFLRAVVAIATTFLAVLRLASAM